MKPKNPIKAILLLAVVVFLYSFANKRNTHRKVERITVEFTDGDNLFLSEEMVNKLLIQKKGPLTNRHKDTLDLSTLESLLSKHEMIANAEVYLSMDGTLGVVVEQRKPIGRVVSGEDFYIDSKGKAMPLSEMHTVRVPLLAGFNKKNYMEVVPLLEKIVDDKFLKHHVVSIKRLPEGNFVLAMRALDFEVFFGKLNRIDAKISNFKAFYKKAMKEGKLDSYEKVDLKFEDQVVATKKVQGSEL